jgi:hypothetical protein
VPFLPKPSKSVVGRSARRYYGTVAVNNEESILNGRLALMMLRAIEVLGPFSNTGWRAEGYAISRVGKKGRAAGTENWRRISLVIERFAEPGGAIC